jgi:dTDP-L-rhamnose 4-epimerase
MQKKILITGGAGFIGSKLANRLSKNGHQVRVLDCLSPQVHGSDPKKSSLFLTLNKEIEFIYGDVTHREDLTKALSGVDTVVHLAAETGTGQSMYAIQQYSDVNIGGTALLLDVIANNQLPITKIIVASSRAIYGEGKYHCKQHNFIFPYQRKEEAMAVGDFSVYCPLCNLPADVVATDEDSPAKPCSVYGVTKFTQEQMVLTVGKALGISAIALRYQNVYGPGQSLSNPYTGILSIFSSRIRNKSSINIFEDGNESRDFVFIDDVVSVTAMAVEFSERVVDTYNVGSGTPTDVKSIAETLQKLLQQKVETKISGQFRIGDIRHNFADLKKVKDKFSFEPTVKIEKGLAIFADWVKTEHTQIDHYEESLEELKVKGLFK